jgi:DNA polymerase-3 subunit alpha
MEYIRQYGSPSSSPESSPLKTRPVAIPQYKKIMVFDTETTGLFQKDRHNLEQQPYITQLSMIVYDMEDKKISKVFNTYIKLPPNAVISEGAYKSTGITKELCQSKGIDICKALEVFYQFYMNSDCIIAHNIDFDKRMILTELERNYLYFYGNVQILNMFNPIFERYHYIDNCCTMRESIHLCNIMIGKDGVLRKYPKYPTLKELYYKLFNQEPTNLHNSLVDTLVCMRCFLKFRMFHHISDVEYKTITDFLMPTKVSSE